MKPIVGPEPKLLLVGSMPGVRSLAEQQYYAHPRNHFWKIIGDLLGCSLYDASYQTKQKIMMDHHIAVWDVLKHCEREGSLDQAIRDEVPNDVQSFLREHPHIRTIGCNGRKAYESLVRHLPTHNEVYISYLPSTSPVPGRNVKTFEQKRDAWEQLFKEAAIIE
ncbi:DNA-deoxyinosine glycosylase [Bacillus daqingensis]|uniref:DNA-deoxyinosine glycosylase n=1 Tax=Bacillus daqingensis TaxID=872396 RepID=A0ABV9NS99_9BACI